MYTPVSPIKLNKCKSFTSTRCCNRKIQPRQWRSQYLGGALEGKFIFQGGARILKQAALFTHALANARDVD